MIKQIQKDSSQSELIATNLHWSVLHGDMQELGSKIEERDSEIEQHDFRIDALEQQFSELTRSLTAAAATTITKESWSQGSSQFAEMPPGLLVMKGASDASSLSSSVAYLDYLYSQPRRAQMEPAAIQSNVNPSVPLWAILQFGAALMLLTSAGSLIQWIFSYSAILNPFVSMLTIVASPFVYLMGRVAKRS